MIDPLLFGIVAFLGGITVLCVVALQDRNIPAVLNALVSLLAVAVPFIVEFLAEFVYEVQIDLGLALPLWIAVAGFLHSFGMLGPYDTIGWWDHLTHTISATLVAALVYAGVIVAIQHSGGVTYSRGMISFVTVVLTFVGGMVWELLELVAHEIGNRSGIEPVLVNYGRRDTLVDLLFDIVGALVVVVADLQLFVPAARTLPDATTTVLLWSVVSIGVVSLVLAVAVGVSLISRI
jgi:hypothetical protein